MTSEIIGMTSLIDHFYNLDKRFKEIGPAFFKNLTIWGEFADGTGITSDYHRSN